MNIETCLNALLMASDDTTALFIYSRLLPKEVTKRNRQYHAFRARILRMDAEKDELEELRTEQWGEIMRQAKRIAELEAEFNHYQDQYHE